MTQIEPMTSSENKKNILKERAECLSKIIEDKELKNETIELVPFQLDQENFALETKYVKEVYPLKDYTFVPCAPNFLYGLTNVRRKILPIIDLKVFFGLSNDRNTEKKLLILSNNEIEFAILTDGFSGIKIVQKDELQMTLPTLTGIRQDFLKGLLIDGTVILDGQKLLTSPHLVINETVDNL